MVDRPYIGKGRLGAGSIHPDRPSPFYRCNQQSGTRVFQIGSLTPEAAPPLGEGRFFCQALTPPRVAIYLASLRARPASRLGDIYAPGSVVAPVENALRC